MRATYHRMSLGLLRHSLLVGLISCTVLSAAEPASDESKKKPVADKETPKAVKEPVTKRTSVKIDGKQIDYEVTAGKLRIEKGADAVGADLFYVSYERLAVPDKTKRPVLFAFNGGPGSSAVWLHLGILGPRIIDIPGDGTEAPKPPTLLKDNPFSLLDACDLVFIDPVSTGYSRAEDKDKAGEFHGLNEDIESVAEFIRRWVTEHQRWASPKYLLGESYGGIRGVGLASYLQSRYGMTLNGLVLLSTLMDYGTLQSAQGNDLSSLVFFPAYTSTALHHKKIQGSRDELVAKATAFAYGPYASALIQGSRLSAENRKAIATTLSELSGIPAEVWEKHHLRIDPTLFRAELLRKEGKTIGRFDSRVAWDSQDTASEYPSYDPSYSLALGAFATSMNDYLSRELGYKEDQPYEILTGKVNPWKWNSQNAVVNVSDRLHDAMVDNPELQVLVMSGHCDLATPPESMAYSLSHLLGLSESCRARVQTVHYDAGHMFYVNPPDLKKARVDLLKFIQGK